MRTGEKVAAAEGSQFGKPATSNGNDQYAELNSNQASSLYQVVNTVPESKYDWGLYHRGRQGKDAMALVVGPKQNVAPHEDVRHQQRPAAADRHMGVGPAGP